MSFVRNPHVAKAEAEEQKALHAKDSKAKERAWREAARLWDRAAARAGDRKLEAAHLAKAAAARARADGGSEGDEGDAPEGGEATSPRIPPELLN